MKTLERVCKTQNGWVALAVAIMAALALAAGWTFSAMLLMGNSIVLGIILLMILALLNVIWVVCLAGYFTLQPNEAAVLILFGKYVGTEKESGFHWTNPLFTRKKVSLRRRNLNTPTIKVNDLRGNPIEIAAVLVWQVEDTAEAVFDVEDYQNYVEVQAEAALRHLTMNYSYDVFSDTDHVTLRGSPDEIARALRQELQERVAPAGVAIEEARLAHLAYAQEIAGAMLQRQQADAIVAARIRIVEGAVGMVEMALDRLSEHAKISLDDERKASMASNLLVVLCSHEGARPIVNAGTLYH